MNDIPTVFILAAGAGSRFPNGVKQLLPVYNDEPIVYRTIRLVHEFDPRIPIYMVTWRKELMFNNLITIDTKKPTTSASDSVLFAEPWWGKANLFLHGDAIYCRDSLHNMLGSCGDFHLYGKVHDDNPFAKHPEGNIQREQFALSFPIEDKDLIMKACVGAGDLQGFRGLCLALYPNLLAFSRTQKIPRCARDFLFYHVIWKFKNFYVSPRGFVELYDHTTDIDTPEEYKEFIEHETTP